MCNFFSCISDGSGNVFYFDWEERKKLIEKKSDDSPDSHAYIVSFFGDKIRSKHHPILEGKEDVVNKYEYNPFTREFKVDQLNTDDDSDTVKRFCKELDFKKIVPALIIKPIVHPFKDVEPPKKLSEKDIDNLKQWIKVWASVRASVGDSVWASVWEPVWAYTSSFFDLPEFKKYKCCVDLWERGLVPSFDGETWRLHGGVNGKAVYTHKETQR